MEPLSLWSAGGLRLPSCCCCCWCSLSLASNPKWTRRTPNTAKMSRIPKKVLTALAQIWTTDVAWNIFQRPTAVLIAGTRGGEFEFVATNGQPFQNQTYGCDGLLQRQMWQALSNVGYHGGIRCKYGGNKSFHRRYKGGNRQTLLQGELAHVLDQGLGFFRFVHVLAQ